MSEKWTKSCRYCGKNYLDKWKKHTIFCSRYCANSSFTKKCRESLKENSKLRIKNNSSINQNGCWIWKKSKSKSGYPKFTYDGKSLRGNRVSYLIFNGEIPDDKIVCHKCDEPSCVNPQHLYLGTHQTNAMDRKNRNRVARGASISTTKLKEGDVINIRILFSNGISQEEISKRFNVHQSTISNIILRKTWKYL